MIRRLAESVIDLSLFGIANIKYDHDDQKCKLKSKCPSIQRVIASLIYYQELTSTFKATKKGNIDNNDGVDNDYNGYEMGNDHGYKSKSSRTIKLALEDNVNINNGFQNLYFCFVLIYSREKYSYFWLKPYYIKYILFFNENFRKGRPQ